jgi:uncharacterized protein with PIN domain
MRFHLDEHVSTALATAWRLHGYDVTTAADAELLAADDELHIEYALREGRIIITHDRDYLAIDARGILHAGIGYCHQQKYSVGQLLTMCLVLDECYTEDEMYGRVEFL